ncbi:unnamed protein product [Cercopithifilaria johnstoni]|uniref:Zinc finger protein n=1 Tax=Cercopithifilaria johnstoni TaxID=2874296 RepID=A0A8J2PVA9_9BILA|nr:unnamed protein product [Cercopithifilaria johnstoni]
MPKKKTGARKKAEKQREIQKKIRSNVIKEIAHHACNGLMQCDHCTREQKIRAFCYFCNTINKAPMCAACGKQKCLVKSGDCIVKHTGKCAIGLQMMGAICYYCEAFICHSKKCLSTHPCKCPLRGAQCTECKRGVWEHGGRIYHCAFCQDFLCEDDQFEHQSSCQYLGSESFKCMSCNRFGMYTCLRCKICCCDDHVRRKGFKYNRDLKDLPCPKCGYPTSETKLCSVSARKHVYGRQSRGIHGKANDSKRHNKGEKFKDINYGQKESDDAGDSDDVNHDGKERDTKHDNKDDNVNHDDKNNKAERNDKENDGDHGDGDKNGIYDYENKNGSYDDGDNDVNHDVGDIDVHDDENSGTSDDNDDNDINHDEEDSDNGDINEGDINSDTNDGAKKEEIIVS